MKNLFIALTLALVSTSAAADGFYQQVIEQLKHPVEERDYTARPFTYSPLYQQVVGNGKRPIDLKQMLSNENTRFTYTPLYSKVTGLGS